MARRSLKTDRKQPRIPPWEWAVAALGAGVVIGLIALMGHRALQEESPVPSLHVEAREVHARAGGFVVLLDVRNSGSGAANVAIEGELRDGESMIESSGVTLDYVPADSHREAGLIFTRDPSRHQLQLRATGYESP